MKILLILREKADKDLIEWYKSLPEGDKANQIRLALKEYLKRKEDEK